MVRIPKETAYQLCEEILRENRGKWFTFCGLWCWGCARFGGDDPAQRCGGMADCPQVVARYARRSPEGRAETGA